MPKTNTWDEWCNHILVELKRLNEGQEAHTQVISELKEEIMEERLKCERETLEYRAKVESALAVNATKINNHGWLLRLVAGAVVLAGVTGVFGAAQSCALGSRDESSVSQRDSRTPKAGDHHATKER